MKIQRLTFEEFLCLPPNDRIEYESVISLQEPFPCDCKQWAFGRVKEVQTILSRDITYEVILSLASDIITEPMRQQAHLVFGLFGGILSSIKEITDIEGRTLVGKTTAKEVAAMEAVGGFERFGRFPEIKALASSWGIDYEKAYAMKWDLAFSTLYLDKITNDYQKKLYEND